MSTMTESRLSSTNKRHTAPLMLVLILLLAAYSNTFSVSWHMDDFPNILNNPAVQMTDLGIKSLLRSMGIDQAQGKNLSRPVANLSFALNWCLHGANVAGFHLVNLIIHIYNALLVYAVIILLGTAPGFPNRHRAHVHSIALGACLLWALNPIQTQAVTYVVQRMTSLATLFYLAALIAYLKMRLTNAIRPKIWWGISTGVAFLLALGTKENAATLPLAIVLIEWIFFRNNTQPLFDRQFGIVIVTGIIFTALFVTVFFFMVRQGYRQNPDKVLRNATLFANGTGTHPTTRVVVLPQPPFLSDSSAAFPGT
jgi:protein O-mannosyl-transferase